MITIILLLAVAQCDPGDPTKCAVHLEKGEAAPFSGKLLTDDLAISLGQKADQADARVKSEVEYQQRLAQVDLTLATSTLNASLEAVEASVAAQKRQADYWEGRAKKSEEELSEGPPWYDHPAIWFSAGVVVTAVLVAILSGEIKIVSQ